jgi:hypothetical protein
VALIAGKTSENEADVLGILGEFQTAGCFWPLINDNSYVYAAFKLYRNYDGAGSAFGVVSLGATASNNGTAGIHAARVSDGKLTLVGVNRSRTLSRSALVQLSLVSGQSITDLKVYRLSPAGGAQVQPVANPPSFTSASFSDVLPAMSATLYEIQTTPGGFAWWQQSEFDANATNPSIAGATADPEGDGLSNLLEYVTNCDPQTFDGARPLRVEILPPAGGSPGHIQLQFQKRKGFVDAQLILQTTTALAPGTWANNDPAALNPTIISIDDLTERWTITIPLPDQLTFYRLTAQR